MEEIRIDKKAFVGQEWCEWFSDEGNVQDSLR